MDTLDFLARSEWPAVTVVALWLIRAPLGRMLDRVSPTKLDAWGFKAEFEKALDKVDLLTARDHVERGAQPSTKEEANVVDSQPNHVTPPPDLEEYLSHQQTFTATPVGIIHEAWDRLENLVSKVVREEGVVGGFEWFLPDVERALRRRGLDGDEIAAIMELRRLKNRIYPSMGSLTIDDALRFKLAAERLMARLTKERRE